MKLWNPSTSLKWKYHRVIVVPASTMMISRLLWIGVCISWTTWKIKTSSTKSTLSNFFGRLEMFSHNIKVLLINIFQSILFKLYQLIVNKPSRFVVTLMDNIMIYSTSSKLTVTQVKHHPTYSMETSLIEDHSPSRLFCYFWLGRYVIPTLCIWLEVTMKVDRWTSYTGTQL